MKIRISNASAKMAYGDRVVVTADKRNSGWRIQLEDATTFLLLTSTATAGPHAGELALFDTALNLVSSFAVLPGHNRSSMIMRSAEDSVTTVVRSDGAGGLHGVAPNGEITFFAGFNDDEFDLLITDSGCMLPLVNMFALALALEDVSRRSTPTIRI